MALAKPRRLKRPYPEAKSARSPFQSDPVFVDGTPASNKVSFIPVVQWSSIRIRGRISTGAGSMAFEFARPARELDPAALPGASDELVYGVDQPAINPTAWVAGVEFSLEITAAEHQGENWLKITLNPAAAAAIDFFDVSGVNLGLH